MTNEFVEQLQRFYSAHRQELYSYALSITGSAPGAEDAVHNAFGRVLRKRRPPRELRLYMFRCVRNAALDERRTAARHARNDSLFEPPNGDGNGHRQLEVEEMLLAVSDDERECIVLKVLSSLTFREIAETRGVSLNTVVSWYRRGIGKLRARLENEP